MAKFSEFTEVTAPAASDLVLLSTGAGTRKAQRGNMPLRAAELTALPVIAIASDFLQVLDATDGLVKKLLMTDFFHQIVTNTNLATDTTLANATHNGRVLQLATGCNTITLDGGASPGSFACSFINLQTSVTVDVVGINGATISQDGVDGTGTIRPERLATLIVNGSGTKGFLGGG